MMVLGGGDISYLVLRAAWEAGVLNSSLASGDLRVTDISCGARAQSSVAGGSGTSPWCVHLQSLITQSVHP